MQQRTERGLTYEDSHGYDAVVSFALFDVVRLFDYYYRLFICAEEI